MADGRPLYIGICENDATTLKRRMNRYQSRCGAGTNERIADRIACFLHAGGAVEIYALKPEKPAPFGDLPVDMVKWLENPLIAKFKPLWNGGAATIGIANCGSQSPSDTSILLVSLYSRDCSK